MTSTDPIEQSILALTAARGPSKSICPSEVARAVCASDAASAFRMTDQAGTDGQSWQSLMTPVRQAAIRLAQAGQIDILRKGQPVPPGPTPPSEVRGVIRLRMRSGT